MSTYKGERKEELFIIKLYKMHRPNYNRKRNEVVSAEEKKVRIFSQFK